jgi:hypothetical protein
MMSVSPELDNEAVSRWLEAVSLSRLDNRKNVTFYIHLVYRASATLDADQWLDDFMTEDVGLQ